MSLANDNSELMEITTGRPPAVRVKSPVQQGLGQEILHLAQRGLPSAISEVSPQAEIRYLEGEHRNLEPGEIAEILRHQRPERRHVIPM